MVSVNGRLRPTHAKNNPLIRVPHKLKANAPVGQTLREQRDDALANLRDERQAYLRVQGMNQNLASGLAAAQQMLRRAGYHAADSDSGEVFFRRAWAMPSAETFSIRPISNLLDYWLTPYDAVIDPMARNSKRGTLTNDIDSTTTADHHMDACDLLLLARREGLMFGGGLFDPPYSPRQLRECYSRLGRSVTQQDTQASTWSGIKDRLDGVIRPGGIVVSCGWNSNGMGIKRGYILREVLLVAHGGNHNDTICTVEQKRST